MAICCAVGCSNRTDSGEKMSFHRFPKDPQLRKAWTVALRRKGWTPYVTSVICSKHFEEKYCRRLQNKTLLTEDAIPTLFPTHKAICKIKKIACPANVPVNISVKERVDKTTYSEESIYAIGFKMTEHIFDSEDFSTEHAENTVRNIEETENVQSSTQKLPTLIYTLTSNEQEESLELLKGKLNNVKAENIQSSTQKLPTLINTLTSNEQEESLELLKGKLNNVKAENIQSSTQKLPTIIYTLTSKEPEESLELLKSKLNNVKAENKNHRKTLRALQQKSRRLNNNIAEMEKFIYNYKENNWISDASLEILKTLPALDNELLALHLYFQQSRLPEECLTGSNPCHELSDIKNDEDAMTIYISD